MFRHFSNRTVALSLGALLAVASGSQVSAGAQPQAAPSGLQPAEVRSAAASGQERYIVRLKAADKDTLLGSLPLGKALDRVLGSVNQQPDRVFRHVFRGAAVSMTPAQARRLKGHPAVASVSLDRRVVAFDTQPNATWGLDRSDQRGLPLNGSYSYPSQRGAGTHVYVVDTGLNADHVEFTGRVGTGRNFVSGFLGGSDPADWDDCNGHGTHVASTAAGTTWGIAKGATVHGIRVLGCNGSGNSSGILAGLDWVLANAERPAVVNMSLGTSGGRSSDLEAAVRRLHQGGITVVVAAGNENANACGTSPAAEPVAVTVGSTTNTDARSSFSNLGSCLDLFAPGSNITAASHSNNTGSTMLSGTSMASPHVAGAAALVAGSGVSSPAQVATTLVSNSTTGVVTNAGTGSPNRLLFVPSGPTTPGTDAPPVANVTSQCSGLTCSFSGAGSTDDRGIASYAWTFGDGTASVAASPSKTYAAAGTYAVTLRVTDTAGQSASRSVSVTVTATAAPCSNCTKYSGNLAAGAQALHPSAGFSWTSGTLRGYLRGPSGADFDLYLQRYQCGLFGCSWRDVASATTASTNEDLAYNAGNGTYRWRVLSYAGSGSYTFYGQPR